MSENVHARAHRPARAQTPCGSTRSTVPSSWSLSPDGDPAQSRRSLQAAPAVQAVAQLQRLLNDSPAVAALTGLSTALQTTHAPIQLSAGRDRARLRAARQNRNRFLVLLMTVVAANIVNGNYFLDDVDDLLEEPDREVLADEVRRRQELRDERRAQGQQQRDQQRNERRRQRSQGGGYRHR